jgi:hypothetical protein
MCRSPSGILPTAENTPEKNGYKYIYAPKYSTAFTKPIFTNLIVAQLHPVKISYPEFHPSEMKSTEQGEMHLRPYVRYGFHCTDFHKTCKYSTEPCTELLRWISPKLVNKYV